MNKTYLAHHGIKGQRWGVRRFQNEDGSLTSAGRKKYNVNEDGTARLKDSYIRGQKVGAIAKSAVGGYMMTRGAQKLAGAKKHGINGTTKVGKAFLVRAILETTIGTLVVSSAATNFVNSMKNKTINTTGMGATPETFSGKAKTQAQVIAAQNRAKKK